MDEQKDYTTLAARLASFQTTIPNPTRKRQSNSKASRTISWPHDTPVPAELARAGFYYNPSPQSHDNTTCFLCDRSLDGWEDEDDPIQEHIKHSPTCAWAILMHISQDQHETSTMEDPTHSSIADARRATFASGWPHESKRGWTCKVERMVEAGWYFAPTPESEDFVSCAYCKLSLDGWEPKDNPFDEHYRRSSDCPFFVFAGTTAPQPIKSKKGRTSKGTRQSTQAGRRVVSQTQSIPDLDDSIDTSTVSIMSTTSAVSKKAKSRGGKKAAKNAEEEPIPSVEMVAESSSLEIPAPIIPNKITRGKKRKSSLISEDDDQRRRESTVKPEPPSKRRNTRTRNSVTEGLDGQSLISVKAPEDAGTKQPKAARKGRARGSSVSRRPSANLKAAGIAGNETSIPDNATIEAALAAELERPLSDEEEVEKTVKPKTQKGKKRKSSEVEDDANDEAEVKPKARKTKGKKAAPKKPRLAKGSLESSLIPESRATPTPVKKSVQESKQKPLDRSPTAQSSDAENVPPSSLPEEKRPPLRPISSAVRNQASPASVGKKKVVLQPATPATARRIGAVLLSPSKIGGGLASERPWTNVDVELVFQPINDEENDSVKENFEHWATKKELSSPEKKMSVEEWIRDTARRAEEELKGQAERMVGIFEREGQRALMSLEGILCEG